MKTSKNFLAPSLEDGTTASHFSFSELTLLEKFSLFLQSNSCPGLDYNFSRDMDKILNGNYLRIDRAYPRFSHYLDSFDYGIIAVFLMSRDIRSISKVITDFFYSEDISFSFDEFLQSSVADSRNIRNVPTGYRKLDVIFLFPLVSLLRKLREHIASPIYITSGFRSSTLNKAVHGKSRSRHLCFKAVDICVSSKFPELQKELFAYAQTLPFRYIENHGTWFHCDIL